MTQKHPFPFVRLASSVILGLGVVAKFNSWHPIAFIVFVSVLIFGVGAVAIHKGWHPQAKQRGRRRSLSSVWRRVADVL